MTFQAIPFKKGESSLIRSSEVLIICLVLPLVFFGKKKSFLLINIRYLTDAAANTPILFSSLYSFKELFHIYICIVKAERKFQVILMLALSADFLDFSDQQRDNLEDIAHYSISSHFEDRGVGIFVDGNNRIGTLHSNQMLDFAGDSAGNI